jgi:hypothetical protein
MTTHIFLSAATPLAAALSIGCSDASNPAPAAPVIVDGRIPVFAAGGPPPKYILPTGKGLDVALDPAPPPRTRNRIEYHNGRMMTNIPDVYYILYGNWSSDPTTDRNQQILTDLATHFCGGPYADIWTIYRDFLDQAPTGCMLLAGWAVDAYSHGTEISDNDVGEIVLRQFAMHGAGEDPVGIYIVIASPDVAETSGFGSAYCGWHGRFQSNGIFYPVGFLGWPERAPTQCAPNGVGPNGTVGADAAASHLVGLLTDMVTDPQFSGWFDKLGLEVADKCVWTYGTTYSAPNGSRANVKLGSRDYLLQQLWVPSKNGGSCALHP